jgi:SAM-dependent methyltransferase
LRDHFTCPLCGSIPRERALIWTLENFFPQWRDKILHESSPVARGASAKLQRECRNYLQSQFFPGVPPGTIHQGVRCENFEKLSFPDASIDLHISQDVMEHVFDPAAAFREIARTLKPGGAHVFTTPLVEKGQPSQVCATLDENGRIVHHREPEYHGNPVSADGALVTRRWGYDITDFIARSCGLHTTIVYIDNLEFGIRAEYIEVLVTRR